MKTRNLLLFCGIIIFPIILTTPISLFYNGINIINSNNIKLSSITGVSNYAITGNIKYQVEINFSLTHNNYKGGPGSGQYWFKFSRLNNRHPNSSMTPYTPQYQESSLLFHKITGSDYTPYISHDRFNNTYDIFNATLSPSQSVILSQKYNVTLNAISFSNIQPSDIGVYDTSDEMFNLYCNHSELYYERDDPNLNSTSYDIVDQDDNPIEKAQKICDWVAQYLTYDGTLPDQEMGALWAYNNRRGDCSEFSSLMITLLRCQGIPARKVTGFVFSTNPDIQIIDGQQKSFYINSNGYANFLGHAWTEYFVPNIGWIACDPTWHKNLNYFNRIDYLRFNLNIGAWFIVPAGLPDESEFPNPCIVYNTLSDFDYEYRVKITILDSNTLQNDFLPFIIGGVIAGVICIIVVVIMNSKKKRKAKEMYY